MTNSRKKPKSLLDHARLVAAEAEAANRYPPPVVPDGEVDTTPPIRVATLLALYMLRERLSPDQIISLARDAGTAVVVQVPNKDWVGPMSSALNRVAAWADVMAHDGSSKTTHKADSGCATVAEHLSCGHNLAGVSQDPERFLPANFLAACDLRIGFTNASEQAIRDTIHQATGRRLRRLPAGVCDLPIGTLVACIRTRSTSGQIVARLEKAVRDAAAAPDAGLDEVPHVRDLHGYGEARDWAIRLVEEVEAFRSGLIPDWQGISSRGIVLASAPGLGKTSFARSVAKSLNAPLVPTSVADWFGQGGSGYLGDIVGRAEAVWRDAPTAAKGDVAVVLLDELDGLPSRSSVDPRYRDFWAPLIGSVLLALSSAVSGRNARLIVIGATNHAAHLDEALVRPGRLDRLITLMPPSARDLAAILRQHLKDDLPDADLFPLANAVAGATGADAAAWVKAARADAMLARRPMTYADLTAHLLPPDTRSVGQVRTVALHESAHALACELLSVSSVDHVSIVSHGHFAGRTRAAFLETMRMTRDDIERFVVSAMVGRAADELFGVASAGASGSPGSDLGLATHMIASLHYSWSLGDGLAYRGTETEAVAQLRIDPAFRAVVEKHLRELYDRAAAFVAEHRDLICTLARHLIDARVVGGDVVRKLIADCACRVASSGGQGDVSIS